MNDNPDSKNIVHQRKDSELNRLIKLTNQKMGLWVVSGFFSILGEIMLMVPIFVVYIVADGYVNGTLANAEILKLVTIATASLLLRIIFKYISIVSAHILAFRLIFKCRAKISEHIGKMPLGFFNDNGISRIKKSWSEDCEFLESYIAHNIPDITSGIMMPVIIAIVLAFIDWRMAIVSFIPVLLALMCANSSFVFDEEKIKDRMRGYFKSQEKMYGSITEFICGMPAIKVFNQTTYSFKRYRESICEYRDYCNLWTKDMLSSWSGTQVIIASSLAIVLPAGVFFYLDGSLSLPALVLFLMMGVGLVKPLYAVIMARANRIKAETASQSILKMLDEPTMPEPVTIELPCGADVKFNGVSFSYGDTLAVNNVSFVAKQGEITALVGPSGSGKSTIASLTARLWDVDDGSVSIGGADVRNMPFDVLNKTVSVVFQKSFIFSDTVYNNIAMAKEGATSEEVHTAAKNAMCLDFINALPNGFDTIIGEGGVQLSGGERQRISIARAILKDAPVLVLDEATAFSDPENEDKIQAAIGTLIKNKTVIVIAHRLSVIVDCNNVIVINRGEIVETGPHSTLVKANGLYSQMWNSHISAGNWVVGQ